MWTRDCSNFNSFSLNFFALYNILNSEVIPYIQITGNSSYIFLDSFVKNNEYLQIN